MEIRPLLPGDDRLALSGVYEASWRRAYRGIVPQDCLDALPAGCWSGFFDTPGVYTLVPWDGDVYAGTASFGASRFPEYGGEGELSRSICGRSTPGAAWAGRCSPPR